MKKFSLTQKIMEKNYILFIISVVISIAIWMYMSMGASNDTTLTVSNIPIQVELSDSARELGLQVFTDDAPTASVTVTGNRAALGSVDESDFVVTASANSVISTGNFNLPVSAVKANPSNNFQITQASPSSINVYVDYFRENSYAIQDNIIYDVAEGYYATTSMPYNSVTISGPQTEISKIKKVYASAKLDQKLTEPANLDVEANIVLYDENDNELSTNLLTMSFKKMTANVTVLPEKTVKLTPVFINKPDGLEISDDMMTITPSEILIAGPSDTLDKLSSVNIAPIDFSTLSNKKQIFDSLSIDIPDGCKSISSTTTAKVSLNLSSLASKTLEVENFKVEGLSDDYTSEVTSKSITVTVIGPTAQLTNLTPSRVTAVIDTTDAQGKVGSVQMPVTFTVSGNGANACWAYGTYQANLFISEKE